MSDLPKYSYANDHTDLESAPLMSAEGQAENGWSKNVAQPSTTVVSASAGSNGAQQRHNVLYVFEPQYPMKGEREQVVGLLGRSKAVSTVSLASLLAWKATRSFSSPHYSCLDTH
jgi:hypothetical protein